MASIVNEVESTRSVVPSLFYYRKLSEKGKYIVINSLTCEYKKNTRALTLTAAQLSEGIRSGAVGNCGVKANSGHYAIKKIDISDTQAYTDVVALMIEEALHRKAGEPGNPYISTAPMQTFTNSGVSYTLGLLDVVNSDGTKHAFELTPVRDSAGFHGCRFTDTDSGATLVSLPKEGEKVYVARVLNHIKQKYFNTPVKTQSKELEPFTRELCTVLGEDSGFTERAKLHMQSADTKRKLILKIHELKAGIKQGSSVPNLEHKSVSNIIALALFAIHADLEKANKAIPKLTVVQSKVFRATVTNLTMQIDWGNNHTGTIAISYMHRTPEGKSSLSVLALKRNRNDQENVIKYLPTPGDRNADRISTTCLYKTLVELIPTTY